MRGANPVRAQERGDGATLWIQEIFYTLQGEGPFIGEPSVFVRTGGCNLRCHWCDTDFESSTWHPSLEELLRRIEELRSPSCDLIVLTGGEPLRQNVVPLVRALLGQGLRVQVETNGTLWLADLPDDPRLTIVCSPKTPSLDVALVPRVSVYKYVLAAGETDAEDGLPTASTQRPGQEARLFRPPPGAAVTVMPRDDGDPAKNAANLKACTEVALAHGYRMSVQLHKLLGIA
jgi:Organic radical activating enzymes